MSIWNRLGNILLNAGKRAFVTWIENQNSKKAHRPNTNQRRRTQHQSSGSVIPGPHDDAVEYNVAKFGRPKFTYHPVRDDAPDPGEVVWTWVPYEERDGRGKDRPVLVMAMYDATHLIFAQTTSKDHDRDAADEAHWGRYWMDIGAGNWDEQHRTSEVRLNRLMLTHIDSIRRTGGRLAEKLYWDVAHQMENYL